MNNIKKSQYIKMIAVFMTVGLFNSSVMADRKKHSIQFNPEQVIESLNLNDDVRQSLSVAMQQQKQSMKSLKSKMREQRYQHYVEKKQLKEAHKEQVKALLTEEQFALFEKAIWEQHQKRRHPKMMKGAH